MLLKAMGSGTSSQGLQLGDKGVGLGSNYVANSAMSNMQMDALEGLVLDDLQRGVMLLQVCVCIRVCACEFVYVYGCVCE